MVDKCPGRSSMRRLESSVVPCPDCGALVELFSDEVKRTCACGRVLLREVLPQCATWCAAAAECLAGLVDPRELQQRLDTVRNDPRAKQYLQNVRERLERSDDGDDPAKPC